MAEALRFFLIGQIAPVVDRTPSQHRALTTAIGTGLKSFCLTCLASLVSVSGEPRSRTGSIAPFRNCLARLSPGRV